MKTCPTCGIEKDDSCFHKLSKSKDGLAIQCKECKEKRAKVYRKENKEKLAKQNKKLYKRKRKIISKRDKENYKNNEHRKKIILKSNLQRKYGVKIPDELFENIYSVYVFKAAMRNDTNHFLENYFKEFFMKKKEDIKIITSFDEMIEILLKQISLVDSGQGDIKRADSIARLAQEANKAAICKLAYAQYNKTVGNVKIKMIEQ